MQVLIQPPVNINPYLILMNLILTNAARNKYSNFSTFAVFNVPCFKKMLWKNACQLNYKTLNKLDNVAEAQRNCSREEENKKSLLFAHPLLQYSVK